MILNKRTPMRCLQPDCSHLSHSFKRLNEVGESVATGAAAVNSQGAGMDTEGNEEEG